MNIGITNICDSYIYDPDVGIATDGKIVLKDSAGNPDKNITVELVDTVIKKDGEITSIGAGESVNVLAPGESLINYYKISDISIATEKITDEKDVNALTYLYCDVLDNLEYTATKENVRADFVVDNKIFYDYYYSDKDDNVTITYSTSKFAVDRTMQMDYSDSYFMGDAREYNRELSEISLGVAMSGYSDPAYSNAYTVTVSSQNNCRATNIMKTLYELDFSEMVFNNYNVALSDSSDKVASAMAMKYITDDEGNTHTLVAAFVRGGGYGAEWASNFNVGSDGDHDGFSNAAKLVTADIHSYVAELQAAGKIKGDLKLWMTSYSRGAAVTNLTAHNLNSAGNAGGVELDNSNFYVYTFATPMGAMNPEKSTVDDSNIFNIVSPLDLVPRVALKAWGYGRYGNDKFMTGIGNVSEAFKQYEGVDKLYGIGEYQFLIWNELEDLVFNIFSTPQEYAESIQQSVVNILALCNSGKDITLIDFINAIDLQHTDKKEKNNSLQEEKNSDIDYGTLALYALFGVIGLNFDINDLAPALVDTLCELDTDEKGKVINTIASLVLPFVTGTTIGGLGQAHYPAHYLAALEKYNSFTDSQMEYLSMFKVLKGACPVDLYVYDSEGNLVANVVNNEVLVDILPTYVVDDVKYVFLDGNEYEVVWKGNDTGSMDYEIQEYDETASLVRTIRFLDLELEDGTTYEQSIPSQILDEAENYAMTCNEEVVESDYDSLLPKGELHTITVNNGNCTTVQARAGEEITIIAELKAEYAFVEWIADSSVSFENSESIYTSFIMPDCDVTISATFEDDYLSSLEFNEDNVDLFVGESYQLAFNAQPENAEIADYVWTSSDETVITVDSDGMITALNSGTAYVTVTEKHTGLSAECRVTVVNSGCVHNNSQSVEKQDATCTQDGYAAGVYCPDCKVWIEGHEIIAAVGHDYGEWEILTPATCEKLGQEHRVCKNDSTHAEYRNVGVLAEHKDDNNDSFCDFCKINLKKPSGNCSHACHSTNRFIQLFWKIINFLSKLFGIESSRYCKCGADHW